MSIKKGEAIAVATPTHRDLLIAALAYAERLQFPVIPIHSIIDGKCTCSNPNCQSPGKHPRVSNWQDKATTDRETIKKWWKQWSDSNIGLVAGRKSGFFVADVDGKQGKESLEQLTDHFGGLPETVEQITGSKGSHFLFKYQEGIGNKVDLLPGIDIRGDNGFIVASPSIHISGDRYEWELSSHPLEIRINEAPKWLLDMVLKPKGTHQKKTSSYWINIMQGVGEGQRNAAATSLAGHLFRRYVDPGLVVEIMKLWNNSNIPPLEIAELETVINSIASKELARRRGGNH
ncbi:bifunctional DNA primase/polymerase [Virgibacillus sp. YIM 98842]|uniref:bifunctional DNA primase/polymerase n=1 Tax=Virgibacillus sp. YIM 98842 TaxID=2663533 RepID=UPI0013DBCEE7|nr:bifunctional DNA primase/polymerase [Virgibacillus sp. YIM 98842]